MKTEKNISLGSYHYQPAAVAIIRQGLVTLLHKYKNKKGYFRKKIQTREGGGGEGRGGGGGVMKDNGIFSGILGIEKLECRTFTRVN